MTTRRRRKPTNVSEAIEDAVGGNTFAIVKIVHPIKEATWGDGSMLFPARIHLSIGGVNLTRLRDSMILAMAFDWDGWKT